MDTFSHGREQYRFSILSVSLIFTWRRAHCRVCADQIEFRSCRVIRRHEKIRLVLVGGIRGRRLSGRRQSLKVELVRVPLAVHFAHDVLVVIVTVERKKTRAFIITRPIDSTQKQASLRNSNSIRRFVTNQCVLLDRQLNPNRIVFTGQSYFHNGVLSVLYNRNVISRCWSYLWQARYARALLPACTCCIYTGSPFSMGSPLQHKHAHLEPLSVKPGISILH